MPESILQQKIFPYDGGFDATKHPLLISPKDVVDSQNLVYTTYSTKRKRPGLTQAFKFKIPGNRKILAGQDFWRLGTQRVCVYNGRQILAIKAPNGEVDDISLTFPVPVDDAVSFTVWLGLLIVCFSDGVTSPKAWVGAGQLFDLHPTAPNAPFCRVWLNKLWMPDPSVPGRILHSAPGSVDFTAPGSGSIDLGINDDDPDGITAIFPPQFGNLYVTKRFSVYRINVVTLSDGTIDFGFTKISDGIGCISHNAVAASPSTIFFPSDAGIHYFASSDKLSGVETDEYSQEIQPLWVNQVNFKRAKYMSGIYDKKLKSYLIVYPSESQSFSNDLWGYSLPNGKWYRWREYNQTCIFRYVEATSKKLLTMLGSKEGDLGYLDESKNRDYNKPISISLQSGIISPGGSPDDQFSFQYIAPIFVPQESGSFTISYKIDGKFIETLTFNMRDDEGGDRLGIEFVTGISVLGGLPQVKIDKRALKGYGMLYEFFIEHEGVVEGDGDDGFEILGILFDVDRVTKKVGRTVA